MTKTDITILASEHCIFSGVVGPMDMFLQAGVMWHWFQEQAPTPYFNVRIATLDGNPVKANNEMLVVPHCSIEDINDTDLIILPSQGAHYAIRDEAFYQRVDWIKQRFNQGTSLASICTGAFSLAATGLLNGKMATTHWGVAHAFRKAFPDVNLRTDLMVTEEGEGRLFCGGGITADLSLTLYLINKYCGREVALQSSRCSLVDLNRLSQLPFSIFIPDSSHGDIEIKRAQTWIEDNYAQSISVDFLAEKAGVSSRQFNRRFKVATQETATKYIQLIRVEAAKRLLERTTKPFDEISLSVGYENSSFFRRLFKQVTSKTPMEYRKIFCQFI
ncbi:hypothetical protein A9Q74_02305 [Colwellia sp. 39_35_sub15_T18]|nr:hypothetical protein A9Q74_02305 [Colwellia sp. 39_35_sub15_T18]